MIGWPWHVWKCWRQYKHKQSFPKSIVTCQIWQEHLISVGSLMAYEMCRRYINGKKIVSIKLDRNTIKKKNVLAKKQPRIGLLSCCVLYEVDHWRIVFIYSVKSHMGFTFLSTGFSLSILNKSNKLYWDNICFSFLYVYSILSTSLTSKRYCPLFKTVRASNFMLSLVYWKLYRTQNNW